MSILIKGGEVVTADARMMADVLCEGEKIVEIGPDLSAREGIEIIDASGKYVFPGFIDPHVHVYLPAMGTYAKDTYETASKAAVLGGTTCFLEFVLPDRQGGDFIEAWDLWRSKGEGHSACDYSLHMAVTRYDEKVEKQLRDIVERGAASFKIHLAYPDVLGLTDEELYRTLGLASELGVIVMGHCENAAVIELLRHDLAAAGHQAPIWHNRSRPSALEADGVHHFLTLAELQKTHACIAHLSCGQSLEVAAGFRRRGLPVWIESLIQFLLLNESYTDTDDFEGAKYVMSPPLRTAADQEMLWQGINEGLIDTISTDHAPFDYIGQKDRGRNDFRRIASGLPGIQDRVNLLYSYGVRKGRIDIQRMIELTSSAPAKLFGLYPAKGDIRPGGDADLVVYDPNWHGEIHAAEQAMNVDYNAFEGWALSGRAETVMVRGRKVVEDGRFVGDFTHGRFVPRKPTHGSR